MAALVSSPGVHAAGCRFDSHQGLLFYGFLQHEKLSVRPDDFGRTKIVGTMTDENISCPTANEKNWRNNTSFNIRSR